jgi:hypothetical protein
MWDLSKKKKKKKNRGVTQVVAHLPLKFKPQYCIIHGKGLNNKNIYNSYNLKYFVIFACLKHE